MTRPPIPSRTATLTVLGWNALAVVTVVIVALATPDSEGWNLLLAAAVAVVGGATVLLGTGFGILIASSWVGRHPSGRPGSRSKLTRRSVLTSCQITNLVPHSI